MKIRVAQPSDAIELSKLLAQLGYASNSKDISKRIANHLADPNSTLLIAEEFEIAIGLIGFHLIPLIHANGSLGRITALVVDSENRRKGVARALIQRVEKIGIGNGCVRFEVTTNESRNDAHSFYQAMGYSPISRRFAKDMA